MRIVIDSNVWISALVFGGKPRKLLESVIRQGHTVVVSEEIYTETRRVLHKKFPDFVGDFEELIVILQPFTEKVKLGSVSIKISRDSGDDFIIETAVIGRAKIIVSGDKDLLVVGKYKNIQIGDTKSILKLLG